MRLATILVELVVFTLVVVAVSAKRPDRGAPCGKKGGFCVHYNVCVAFSGIPDFATNCTNRPDSCVPRDNKLPGGTIPTVCCLPPP